VPIETMGNIPMNQQGEAASEGKDLPGSEVRGGALSIKGKAGLVRCWINEIP
jgi:hypothetical protein